MRDNEFGAAIGVSVAGAAPNSVQEVAAFRYNAFPPAFLHIITSFSAGSAPCDVSARLLVFEGEPTKSLMALSRETNATDIAPRYGIRVLLDVMGVTPAPNMLDFSGAPLTASAGKTVYVLLMCPYTDTDASFADARLSLSVLGIPNTSGKADVLLRGYVTRPSDY